MDEREKIQAEIEARMITFNDTINEIRALAEKKNEDLSSPRCCIKNQFNG